MIWLLTLAVATLVVASDSTRESRGLAQRTRALDLKRQLIPSNPVSGPLQSAAAKARRFRGLAGAFALGFAASIWACAAVSAGSGR